MTNKQNLISELGIDPHVLEAKKEQTTKKIEYVRAYVEGWLYVMTNKSNIKTITFIDAMCNAGLYSDGDLCTIGEVCLLFRKFAKRKPGITFYLYINDLNQKRVDTATAVCDRLIYNSCTNVSVVHANLDVNDFLREAATTNKVPRGFDTAILLFVDPYNAHTVHLDALTLFIRSRYCEVLFNWFSSDPVRNRNSKAIADCLDGLEIPSGTNGGEVVANKLRTGKMKYVFRYPFRISTNVELYQIIFVTPNKAGLEKLKAALWDTFHGAAYYKNLTASLAHQQQLFKDDELEESNATTYAKDAKIWLLKAFSGREAVTYNEIETFLLERTMLREGQMIKQVIKPLVASAVISKDGKARKGNYKEDTYSFPETLENVAL
jgi:three-Cys-motif partner protein